MTIFSRTPVVLPKIKAGVLSEDAVWNMNENINEILEEMKKILKDYSTIS